MKNFFLFSGISFLCIIFDGSLLGSQCALSSQSDNAKLSIANLEETVSKCRDQLQKSSIQAANNAQKIQEHTMQLTLVVANLEEILVCLFGQDVTHGSDLRLSSLTQQDLQEEQQEGSKTIKELNEQIKKLVGLLKTKIGTQGKENVNDNLCTKLKTLLQDNPCPNNNNNNIDDLTSLVSKVTEQTQKYQQSQKELQTTIQQQIQDLQQQQTAQQDQLQQSQEKDDNSQEAESETQEAQNDESQKSLVPEQIQDEQQQEIQQIQSDQQQYQNQYQQKLNELRTQGEKDNNESIKQLFEIIKLQQERINKLRTQTLELTKQKNDFRIVAHNAEKKINELLDEESEEASQQ